jgi:hypothetical protein
MRSLINILILTFICQISFSQVFLQIEKMNSPKSIKLQVGTTLEYTLKEYPDVWRKEVIRAIHYDGNLIVLDEGYRTLDEINQIRLYRPWAKKTGYGLMQFGAGWFLFGGIATLVDSEYTMSGREIVIGGVFASVGYLIKTLFYKKKLTMGKNARLRIVDIRFFSPDYSPQPGN